MAEEVTPTPRGRVSNEVLEERLTQYFSRTTETFEEMKKILDRFEVRLERSEGNISLNQERMRDHEHLINHPEAEKRLAKTENAIVTMQAEIQKLNHLDEIEKAVISLSSKVDVIRTDLDDLQSKHEAEVNRIEGKREVITGLDKGFLKLVLATSLVGTLVTLLINLEKLW